MHCVTHVYVKSYTEFLNDFVTSGLSTERTALRHHMGLAVPLLFAVTKKKNLNSSIQMHFQVNYYFGKFICNLKKLHSCYKKK